ncbi:helix-turn-helix domain-containing protein, partial [Butyrivibrio sp. AE2015]
MSESIRGNHSHLLLSDRIYIEQELNQGSTFYSIAKVLHKDPTTISKEVKRSRSIESPYQWWDKCRLCWDYKTCR